MHTNKVPGRTCQQVVSGKCEEHCAGVGLGMTASGEFERGGREESRREVLGRLATGEPVQKLREGAARANYVRKRPLGIVQGTGVTQ